ncbi:MAG: hypothetical protein ACJ748_08470 [Flavisolibacter sp.]
MELKMYLANRLVDSIPIKISTVVLPGYLGHLKRKLERKHTELIKSSGIEPEYFVYTSFSSLTPVSSTISLPKE